MKYVGIAVMFIMYLFLNSAWSGYVLSILWAWFVVGRFSGAPTLSIPAATGIAMIVRYLTYQEPPEKAGKTATERIIGGVLQAFLYPLTALLFGAIVRLFL